MVTVPFHAVAGPAEQLQILDVIGTAITARDNMVHREVPKREDGSTAVTVALLLPKELMFVRPVVREHPKIRAPWNVRPMVQIEEQIELVLQARFNKRRGHLGQVDSDPLAV